ncbi:MAG: LolA-like putative outer membrane lipoprotein chaperone [Bacteroidales bacterium]|nr:LolA-like putative outer membrane lipoprotein chaperone [Bacteroidales bacterium]
MKRVIIAFFTCLATLMMLAQAPATMIDKCVAAINAGGGVTANYSVTTSQGTSSGTIAMQGNKFRIISSDAKCWYDGKTQWSWSPVTSEVNITAPTASELQLTNPMAAAAHFKACFNMKRAKAKTDKTYVIKLTPKKKDNIKTLWLYFDESTSLLRTARFEMNDKSVYTVKITNYKHKSLPTSTFTFDKSQVPAGTEVVDLR